MAYVRKLIAKDETIIGIARLHWIYVIRGILWFVSLSAIGWGLNYLMLRGLMAMTSSMKSTYVPGTLLSLNNGMMFFMMGAGLLIFLFMVMKVLVTEVALTSRRVIFKEGLLFVKVKHIDLEEIRGENMDMGYFGRILNYGYIMLDCRFIGDVRLPAIENPERFLRGLHKARSETQDALSVVVGKGNAAPLNVVQAGPGDSQQPQTPEVAPPEPSTPEIIPPAQQPGPEVNPPQTPREIPVPPTQPPGQPAPQTPPPVQPPAPPTQPIPAPPPSEPPLQPPATASAAPSTPTTPPQQPPAPQQPIDAQVMAQAMAQVMPQMAQEVARQLVEQGVIGPEQPEPENDVDTHLIESFDEARLDKGAKRGSDDKLEYAIH